MTASMKTTLIFFVCYFIFLTITATPPSFRDVFVDVPQDTQHYRRLLVDAEKTVNMRRNETAYPHRKLIATHYARHKSVIDTGVAEAGITVAQTNCTVANRFEYRQNYDNYQNCAVIENGFREICDTRVVHSIFRFEPPEEQGVMRKFNCSRLE